MVAIVAGLADWSSVPAVTQPSIALWALPGIGVLATIAAIRPGSIGLRALATPRLRAALGAGGAVLVGAWGWLRWEWLWRAILPTGLPDALTRVVTGAALAGGIGLALTLARQAVAPGPAPS
jgi:hypothetical protein